MLIAPKNSLLLKTLHGEVTKRPPVWLMRQAGRSDPQYRAYREQSPLDLHGLFRSPDDAIAISLLPRRLGVDAIIFFQDILTPLEPMGADFLFNPGPTLPTPIDDPKAWRALKSYTPSKHLSFVKESLMGVSSRLSGALPLLGFAGAPFTLAAFLIEGKSPAGNLSRTLALANQYPGAFESLLNKLADMTIAYLSYQHEYGAHAVQLFESVGHLIPNDIYERFVQPIHCKIIAELPKSLPLILFVRESPFLDEMLATGVPCISIGANVDLAQLRTQAKNDRRRITIQGNVNNELLRDGTAEAIRKAVQDCMAQMKGHPHIMNLSHGVLPETPFENVQTFVSAVTGDVAG